MHQTTQRAFWNGPPERLPDGFVLIKRKEGDRTFTAVCRKAAPQPPPVPKGKTKGKAKARKGYRRTKAEAAAHRAAAAEGTRYAYEKAPVKTARSKR